MIIDAHTHIFPDHQAASILNNLRKALHVPTYGKATATDLLRHMDANGITSAVIHMVAPVPQAVDATNTWLMGLDEERFIRFGTLHPRMQNKSMHDAILRLVDNNVRGIKLQPDIQDFTPDDRDLTYPLYAALSRQGLPVMFHVGGEPLPRQHDRSTPAMIRTIANDFPELTIIAAHLGGLNMWQDVLELLAGRPNIYMESSLSYNYITPDLAQNIIQKHGHQKIFFGSDYPFGSIQRSLEAARSVPFLTADQRLDILGRNAFRFFFDR